jgi:hypothetical protein
MERRPRTVTVVAVFLFAATAVAAIVGTSLLFPNTLLDRLWKLNRAGETAFRAFGKWGEILLLALGAATSSAAVGLLQRRAWAWCFAVALFAIDGVGNLVSLLIAGDWWRSASGALISSAFLFFLTRDPVRRYCGQAR